MHEIEGTRRDQAFSNVVEQLSRLVNIFQISASFSWWSVFKFSSHFAESLNKREMLRKHPEILFCRSGASSCIKKGINKVAKSITQWLCNTFKIQTNLAWLPKRYVFQHFLLQSDIKRGIYTYQNHFQKQLNINVHRRSDLCFCRRICSRAFISTLSKYVAAVTQCFTLPFIGNSGGNNEPHKIVSIDSGLHQIKQPNGRSHRLTLHYTNNTITVGLSPTAFQKEGDKKSFHLNKKKLYH